jgi:hypothetical protein
MDRALGFSIPYRSRDLLLSKGMNKSLLCCGCSIFWAGGDGAAHRYANPPEV